jgi:lysophospholipase L1-like esterase
VGRARRASWLGTLAGAVLLAATATASAAADDLSFTPTLPGGYVGAPAGRGMVPETRPEEVTADRPVDVTVDSPWCDVRGEYRWSVDGAAVPSQALGPCSYRLTFDRPGSFQLTLSARVGDRTASVTQEVAVKGRLIVSLGDSVASGEGVPDIGFPGVRWQSRQCHRSARAAPALAAQRLQRRDPSTPITFVHLACSGATIANGLLGSYGGIEPKQGPPLGPQLDALEDIQRRRPVDAVLISVGANDVHFSAVVKACALGRLRPGCFTKPKTLGGVPFASLEEAIRAAVARLPAAYDDIAARLTRMGIAPSHVYLQQYFDPTLDARGVLCRKGVLGIRAEAIAQAARDVLAPLNAAGRAAADRLRWRYVDGIAALFSGHGYCVRGDEAWVVKLMRSFVGETRIDGTVHPNAEGHRQMAVVIERALAPTPHETVAPSSEGDEQVSDTAAGLIEAGGLAVVGGLMAVFLRANVPRWRLSRGR